MIIKLSRGKEAIIDDEDYEFLNQWKWFCSTKGYALRNSKLGEKEKRTNIWMHRVVLNLETPQVQVDHINENKLDNRKCNLRIVNNSQNQANISKCRKSKSNFKGVMRRPNNKKWKVVITVDQKKIYIGDFIEEVDAAKAYNEAAIKYFGEFARLNEIPIDNKQKL